MTIWNLVLLYEIFLTFFFIYVLQSLSLILSLAFLKSVSFSRASKYKLPSFQGHVDTLWKLANSQRVNAAFSAIWSTFPPVSECKPFPCFLVFSIGCPGRLSEFGFPTDLTGSLCWSTCSVAQPDVFHYYGNHQEMVSSSQSNLPWHNSWVCVEDIYSPYRTE